MGLKSTTHCLGYQQITSLASAAMLTVPKNATLAIIRCETQNCRYRDDGVAPTASVGFPLLTSDILQYDGDLARIQFIEVSGSAKLNVLYYE